MGRQVKNLENVGGARLRIRDILITSLMLFSMFFGAGNLIFPPMMGASAGEAFGLSIAGFLVGAVLLPVIAIIAVAVSGSDVRDLSARAGRGFGLAFSMVTYLSIGAFYGIPRTGAVSFSIAFSPVTHWDSPSARVAFNLCFFAVAFVVASNPNAMVERLGKILTPVLLGLLFILVLRSILTLDYSPRAATGNYAQGPLTAGFLEGYMTMDSMASLAFGIVVVSALRYRGVNARATLVRGTATSGVFAGILLAVIYVGLGIVGRAMPHALDYKDGASMLSDASALVLGRSGQVFFGSIVLLACMTTAVGLLAASGEFFSRLFPRFSYRGWLLFFTFVSFVFSSSGLEMILKISGPVIGFVYPIGIAVVFATLADRARGRSFSGRAAFCGAAWMASLWSFFMFLQGLGFTPVEKLISWVPLHGEGLGWICPTVAVYALGLIVDAVRPADEVDVHVVEEAKSDFVEK